MYFAFQSRIRGVKKGRYKLIEYRTDDLRLSQLFDLETDPYEICNFYDITGYEGITDSLRCELLKLRDTWEDQSTIYGQQFWQQWMQYEAAEVHGVGRPKGANMANQISDWGTNKS